MTLVKVAVWSFPQEMWTVPFMFRPLTGAGVRLSVAEKGTTQFTWKHVWQMNFKRLLLLDKFSFKGSVCRM